MISTNDYLHYLIQIKSVGHRAICSCPSGYSGDPYRACIQDPCSTSPCGIHAQCKNQGR